MAVVLAGERSGAGKTTVMLSILAALARRQQRVQPFKVGPDYIDPMFHSHVTGRACRNLDPVLTSETYVQQCFAQHIQSSEYALIEGVMGLFDGASGRDDFGSTAHVARLLNLPVLLVLNCSSLSGSIAAIAHGYRSFDPRIQIVGVILNRVGSDRHLELLKLALQPLSLPILGVLRRQDEITIPDRHLGLVPSQELNLHPLLQRLADLGDTCFDWAQLLPLLSCPKLDPPPPLPVATKSNVRVAIAKDLAFSFYYADNLDLFGQLGAELVPWSPLTEALPADIQGLYFGGGFPEVFAADLAQNQMAIAQVRQAIQSGMPTYAECGGLMYLCEQIIDFADTPHSMTGILPVSAAMSNRLTLGYRQAITLQDSPLVNQGDQLWGHEFHRSRLSQVTEQPLFELSGYDSQFPPQPEGWKRYNVHASYLHLHFGAQPDLLRRFLRVAEGCSASAGSQSLSL